MNIIEVIAIALRQRQKPSPIAKVTTIKDLDKYLNQPYVKNGGPAVVCQLRPCFAFVEWGSRAQRVVLVFFIQDALLYCILCLRSGNQASPPNQPIFISDLTDPECLPRLGDALRDTIGLVVPSFSR